MSSLHTTHTWRSETTNNLASSAQAHAVSSSLDKLSSDLKNLTTTQQDNALATVHRAFESRIAKTEGLKANLEESLSLTCDEIARISAKEEELAALLVLKQRAYDWNQRMQNLRSTRPQRENTNDKTQYCLVQQGKRLHETIVALTNLISAAQSDHQKLDKCKAALEKDLAEKDSALNLDKHALQSSQETAHLAHYEPPGTVGITTIGTWVKTTEENIREATQAQQNSTRLRGLAENQAAECLAGEKNTYNNMMNELRTNMAATTNLINGLQEHLSSNDDKILQAQHTYNELTDALHAKFPALDLAKHRYTHRTTDRPSKEVMGDEVHQALRDEHISLDRAAQDLAHRIEKVKLDIQALQDMQAKLQADLKDKEEHLRIDSEVQHSANAEYPAPLC